MPKATRTPTTPTPQPPDRRALLAGIVAALAFPAVAGAAELPSAGTQTDAED